MSQLRKVTTVAAVVKLLNRSSAGRETAGLLVPRSRRTKETIRDRVNDPRKMPGGSVPRALEGLRSSAAASTQSYAPGQRGMPSGFSRNGWSKSCHSRSSGSRLTGGGGFFAITFQKALRNRHIKFRRIRPRSPHLNGKVERSQQTDRAEFWATVELDDANLERELDEWQHFYNWHRAHSSLGGQTPIERCCDLLWHTPSRAEVVDAYVPSKEPFRARHYSQDLEILRLKRCL